MLYCKVLQGNSFGTSFCVGLLFVLSFMISGCLPARTSEELNFVPGATIESLTSNALLSYATPERSISGSGILMYQKPDHMRAIILSPFGSVLQEVYVAGDRVTVVDTGNGTAFSGAQQDLPETGDFSGWRSIHWLIDIDPPDKMRNDAVTERLNRFGEREKAYFAKGLLVSKSTTARGTVNYGRYVVIQGVPVPLEIAYETAAKEKFTIVFEDPEINAVHATDAFLPQLSKLRVYPLAALK